MFWNLTDKNFYLKMSLDDAVNSTALSSVAKIIREGKAVFLKMLVWKNSGGVEIFHQKP